MWNLINFVLKISTKYMNMNLKKRSKPIFPVQNRLKKYNFVYILG